MKTSYLWMIPSLLVFVLILFFGFCTLARESEPQRIQDGTSKLIRYVDPQMGVVCYRVSGDDSLSCLPLPQSGLGQQ